MSASWLWNIWGGSALLCWHRCCCPPAPTPSPNLCPLLTTLVSCFITTQVYLLRPPHNSNNSRVTVVCCLKAGESFFQTCKLLKNRKMCVGCFAWLICEVVGSNPGSDQVRGCPCTLSATAQRHHSRLLKQLNLKQDRKKMMTFITGAKANQNS